MTKIKIKKKKKKKKKNILTRALPYLEDAPPKSRSMHKMIMKENQSQLER